MTLPITGMKEDASGLLIIESGIHSAVQYESIPAVLFDETVSEMRYYPSARVRDSRVYIQKSGARIQSEPVVMSADHLGFSLGGTHYIKYRDVDLIFKPTGGRFMKPSIETMLLCLGLQDLFEKNISFNNIIDIGSGTGFIGKYAAINAPGEADADVTLLDIDPKAAEYARSPDASMPTKGKNGRKVNMHFEVSDAIEWIKNYRDYDLVISNPPYIPTEPETRSLAAACPAKEEANFWEGAGCVSCLIEHIKSSPAGSHLALVFTSLSLKSLAVQNAFSTLADHKLEITILVEREVGWKPWFAGDRKTSHLMAHPHEINIRNAFGDLRLFVGATAPDTPRLQNVIHDGRVGRHYYWHVVYVAVIKKMN